MARIIKKFLDRPTAIRLLVSALATAIPFYFAAFLAHSVTEVARLGGASALGVHALSFVLMITLVVFIGRYAVAVYEHLKNVEAARVALRLHAYAHLDRLVSWDVRQVDINGEFPKDFIERFVASTRMLQNLVGAAYESFEAAFGKSARTEDRIDFEVTFMTKSYEDGYITIPAWANRDARAPRSMILRKDRQPIYENTVTASTYRDLRPTIRIIEDTSDPAAGYQELYPDQKKRIKSSIVFPVLSDANELLGTLVVHCDAPRFFRHEDEKYWTDLLEIFSKRLALVKLKLDKLQQYARSHGGSLSLAIDSNPF